MADYAASYGDFREAGAEVVALSVDDRARSEAMVRELNLPYIVLCDPRREVVTAWGLLNRGEKGGIAYPATFLIDRDRKVRFRSLEDVASRASAADMASYARAIAANLLTPAAPRRRLVNPGTMFLQAVANAVRRGVRVSRPDS